MAVYICNLCNARSTTLSLYMSHLRQVHQTEDVAFFCPVDECNASYPKVNSLCSHIYRKHKNVTLNPVTTTLCVNPSSPHENTQDLGSGSILDFSIPSSITHDVNQLLNRDSYEQKKQSSMFLLQLKEERLITQAAINDVVSGCRGVFKHTVNHIKAGVNQKLAQSGIDPNDVDGLDSIFHEVSDPFVELETAYLQDKFITKELQCIEPIEIQVGCSRYVSRQSGAKRRKILVRDNFYYVPLLKTLKQLLQLQSVRDEVLKPLPTNRKLMYDLSDGTIFQQHPFFKNNPQGLQIVAYYDEVETCNPLGSSSGKFKLGCVFFTLSNLRPLFRSGLKSIFLIAIAKSTTIKVNGIDSILKPFLNDLKILHEKGISVEYAGKNEVWKGALLAFLADNLAAHEVGGFKESFSFARRICRSCLTDKQKSQTHFREDEFVIRDHESHSQHCSRLRGPDGPSVSIEFGINRRSSLDSLPNFSVVDNMPHDIMHDLFEGVVPCEFKLFLQYCISQSVFSLDTFNHRLAAFDFGYSEIGDRPASMDSEYKLRQTASQMWLLARIFPLLVGDLLPRGNSNWDCLLKLLKICEICTAPVVTADNAAYLELLVEEHHKEFKRVYPGVSLIPKMHFMIHFARQILKFGPLIQTWTMRHEAKLRIIKRAARVSNFKNVCQTVAKRHQHLLCFYIHSSRLLSTPIKEGVCKQVFMHSFSDSVQDLFQEHYQLTEQSIIFTLSYIIYNNINYKPSACVMLLYDELEPTFAKIHSIIKTQSGEIVLVLNEVVTNYYDSHYRSFCVSQKDPITPLLHNIKNLSYYNIFHLRRNFAKDGKLYINLKHCFVSCS